jgi:hypothetical protein
LTIQSETDEPETSNINKNEFIIKSKKSLVVEDNEEAKEKNISDYLKNSF